MLTMNNRLMSDPFEALWREFGRVSNGNGASNGRTAHGGFGSMSLWENDQNVYVEFDLPGARLDDIELLIENGSLRFHVDRKPHNVEGKQWYDERRYGRFERSIALPETVDPESIDATLEDGVLRVTLSRKAEAQPKKVTIQCRNSKENSRLEHEDSSDS